MPGRNPFEEIEQFFERMSRQFEESADWPVGVFRDVPVDVVDRGEEFEVTVDLPGFSKDDVELRLTDDTLRIRAERDAGEGDARYVRRERGRDSVSRSVSLPEPVDEEAVDATLSDGVLTVTLGKRAAGDARTIDIE